MDIFVPDENWPETHEMTERVTASGGPYLDSRGAFADSVANLIDVTNRNRAEVAVRESEAKYREKAAEWEALFPVAQDEGPDPGVQSQVDASTLRGDERILFVDDEAVLGDLAREGLGCFNPRSLLRGNSSIRNGGRVPAAAGD